MSVERWKGGKTTWNFDLTTLKPLTRAQTRQILDHFSDIINQNAGRTRRMAAGTAISRRVRPRAWW